jgi:NAD(P)-dependent dehydrogenase (short-subunit alcohol dehydrogenase family)
MHLQEKIAVISGGARGLGRAYTEAILKAGGKVLKNVWTRAYLIPV